MGFFDIVKKNVKGFKNAYNEGRQNALNQQFGNERDTVIKIAAIAGNKDEVIKFISERTGWTYNEAKDELSELPFYYWGTYTEMTYWEQELDKLEFDDLDTDLDIDFELKLNYEIAYLKINSVGENIELVTKIVEKTMEDKNEAEEFLDCLPDCIEGPAEYIEYVHNKLLNAGADVMLLDAETYDMDYFMENNVISTDEWHLVVTDASDQKVKAIKIIKDYTSCSLAEAKDFVDNLPQSLSGSEEVIREIHAEFMAIGGKSAIIEPKIEPEKENVPQNKFCTSCGSQVEIGNAFCAKCGARL